MNNFNILILSSIFKNLSLHDLISCSTVCKQWNEIYKITKPRHLFLCYGTNFFPVYISCLHKPYIKRKEIYLTPHHIIDNSILKLMSSDLLKNIKSFIFYGNDNFVPPDSFDLFVFPKLKYVKIMDRNFCDIIHENFKKHLEEKKKNPKIQWKYFSPSIETLIMEHIELPMFLMNLDDLKNIVIGNFNNYFEPSIIDVNTKKWKSIEIKNEVDYFSESQKYYLFDFLMNKCPLLESIKMNFDSIEYLWDLLSNPILKHICITIGNKNDDPEKYYREVILNYKDLSKSDFILCVDSLLIKNSNGILSFDQNFNTLDYEFQVKHNFHLDKNFLILNNYPYFDLLKKLPSFDFITSVLIDNILVKKFLDQDEKISYDLKMILAELPKNLKSLHLNLNNLIHQNIFDSIPKQFPYLEKLNLGCKRSKISNFNFVSQLKFLNSLMLNEISINCEEMLNVLDKLNFLTEIRICLNEEEQLEFKELLKNTFDKKKLTSLFSLEIDNNFCLIQKK